MTEAQPGRLATRDALWLQSPDASAPKSHAAFLAVGRSWRGLADFEGGAGLGQGACESEYVGLRGGRLGTALGEPVASFPAAGRVAAGMGAAAARCLATSATSWGIPAASS
jgi:hypothetical protein